MAGVASIESTMIDTYNDYSERRKQWLEATARTRASVAVSAAALVLPKIGATVGSAIPIPGVGTAIGYGVGLVAEYGTEQLNEKVVNGDIN